MQVVHYLELSGALERSGIGTAAKHQREALRRADVEVVSIPQYGRARDTVVEAVTGRATGSADLVHCNMMGPGTLAIAMQAKRTGTTLVLHAHVTAEDFAGSFRGSTALSRPLQSYLRLFYSLADLVCCPSQYTRAVLESYPVDAPIKVVSNGVDTERLGGYESLRSSYRSRFNLSGLVVFAVGNVFERKGLSTFCRLARRLPYEFVWFGPYESGPLASRAVRKWTQNPPENVTFTGWVDDVRGAYGAGDVFLFPSHVENQGIAVLEAMACGKPVVLRRLPVFEEYYTHGEDCLMCETFSEFQNALDRLEADAALRRRLGENAQKTAEQHSIDRLADDLTGVYECVSDS